METWCPTSFERSCANRPLTHRALTNGAGPDRGGDGGGDHPERGFLDWFRTLSHGDGHRGWDLFVDRYGPWLRRRCWYVLQRGGGEMWTDEVEELVQEIYCRLLENRRRRLRGFEGDSERALRSFLARVARSVVLSHLRRRFASKRSQARSDSQGSFREGAWCDRPPAPGERKIERLEGVPCLRRSPESEALRRQERRDFFRRCRETDGGRDCLRNLRIAWLALHEGWSSREIAPRVSLSPSAVDTVVYRVRRRLEAYGIEVPERL